MGEGYIPFGIGWCTDPRGPRAGDDEGKGMPNGDPGGMGDKWPLLLPLILPLSGK